MASSTTDIDAGQFSRSTSENMSDLGSPRRLSTGLWTAAYNEPPEQAKAEPKESIARSGFSAHICGKSLNTASKRVIRATYLYGSVHGAVDQLLPACFKALERDMGFTPQSLGFVSSVARVSHVLTCPIWGVIIDCCGRRRIFSCTALGWGAAISAIFYATQQSHIVPIMCVLGVFMAAMGPLSQKVIAQEIPENCPQQHKRQQGGQRFSLRDTAYVFSNGSVWVMLIMGILNGIPRSAIHFSTMYFQYCNIPDWWASFIVSSSWIAAMIVAPVIGLTGDFIHSRHPHHGRQCLAQVCIVARCVLMTVMLTCVPRESESLWIFLVLAILIGFLAGWPGVGVNRPILTEIVHPDHRATTFALVSCLEGVGAALLGAPIVGYLCEHVFGYVKPPHGAHIHSATIIRGNARAISLSMLCMTVAPWLLSIVAYGVLHLTYKFDSHHGADHAGMHLP
ncbi:hypothetical protein cyc_05985 [Cyclospora cayetanensis]|uniref:Major facilitator family protein n=1 Tax=Cyclospora cayetanensis TaxID=88456 RepID=A0A1D3DAC5_9EIME|nr:hypothetical protein cyc_05985 [Cyclospora cayetanensis]